MNSIAQMVLSSVAPTVAAASRPAGSDHSPRRMSTGPEAFTGGSESSPRDPAGIAETQQTDDGASDAVSSTQAPPTVQENQPRRRFLDCLHRVEEDTPGGARKQDKTEESSPAQGQDMAGLLAAWMAQCGSTAEATVDAGKTTIENAIPGTQTDAGGTALPLSPQISTAGVQELVASAVGQGPTKDAEGASVADPGPAAPVQTAVTQTAQGDAGQVQLPPFVPSANEAPAQVDVRPGRTREIAAVAQVNGTGPSPAGNPLDAGISPQVAGDGQAPEAMARLPQTAPVESTSAASLLQNPASNQLQAARDSWQESDSATDNASVAPGRAGRPQADAGRAETALFGASGAEELHTVMARGVQTQAGSDGSQLFSEGGPRGQASGPKPASQQQHTSSPSVTFQALQAFDEGNQSGGPASPVRLAEGERVSAAALPGQSSDPMVLQALGLQASQTAAPGSPAAPDAANTASQAPQPVLDQIAQAVHSGAAREGRQMVIHLNPPELGNVRMTFRSDADGVRCSLQVDTASTFQQMQHEAPALASRLVEGGVHFKGIEITMRESGGSTASSSSTLQDGQAGRNPPQNPWQQSGRPWQESRSEQAPQTSAEPAPAWTLRAGDGAVNVWR